MRMGCVSACPACVLLTVLLPLQSAVVAAPLDVIALDGAFRRVTAPSLWPGFEPRRIPRAIFDGTDTWLFGHPNPPQGFAEVPQLSDTRRFSGRWKDITANSSIPIEGVPTATWLLRSDSTVGIEKLATGLVHECFHVFQRANHPAWHGNEVELFTYPVEDPAVLAGRRRESEALRRALAAAGVGTTRRWAAAALEARRERHGRLSKGARDYERGTELNEGLASYVEWRAGGRGGACAQPAAQLGAEAIREWAYRSGCLMARVLDRLAPGWQHALESGVEPSLDELLDEKLGSPKAPPLALSDEERQAIESQAKNDVGAIETDRARAREGFLAKPGPRVIIVSETEPLQAEGFDPLNARRLAVGEVLHGRFLKLGNTAGHLSVLDAPSLTLAAGTRPLFSGVRSVEIHPTVPLRIERSVDGRLRIVGGGLELDFQRARSEQDPGGVIRVLVGK